jgi:hypothetical protein
MSTISINQVEELTSIQSVSYIRPLSINITGALLKPNTRYNLFFDGKNVNYLTKQEEKATGDPLISDSNGVLFATLYVPGFLFPAGNKSVVLTQESSPDVPSSSNISRAEATFISYSNDSMYEVNLEGNVITVKEAIEKPIALPVQPLLTTDDAIAQSFFTYGVAGGIFVTSIELYFKGKDNFLPIWVELREMVNGYPSKNYISPYAVTYANANQVNTSSNASVSTKFTFSKLVYLPQDKEFCFVVRSRSNNYDMWVSRIGELAQDTNKMVTEQPYAGSLFKTDNNVTWSVEQFEDVKFKLNRAEFNTSVNAVLKMPLTAQPVIANGTRFQTMIESNVVILDFPHKHGLDTNSVVRLVSDAAGKYNGVAGSLLNGTFNVFKIFTDYSAAFTVPGAEFTSTGQIKYGGRINNITVTSGGSGYSSATPPTVTISAPNESGTQATATAVIENGKIERITILNRGTGYTGNVTVTIAGGSGSGATAIAQNDANFGVSTNRVFNEINPSLSYSNPPDTEITSSITTTLGRFTGGSLNNYNAGDEYNVRLGVVNNLGNNFLLASRYNEQANMSDNPSCVYELQLSSSNSKVSPVIDMNQSQFVFYNNKIFDLLPDEGIESTNPTGSIDTITITNGGSGYTTAPLITVGGGRGAKLKANLTGGVVTSISILDPGSGFFKAPALIFDGGNPTVKAAATATITKFNSELMANNGSSSSKYITKTQLLQTVSKSIKVYVNAYSNNDSSFEVYLKSSLSSSNKFHDSYNWKLLDCDVTRNKSQRYGQEFEYQFYADDLEQFDVYSIKIVIRTLTPWDPPYISNYRAIILA